MVDAKTRKLMFWVRTVRLLGGDWCRLVMYDGCGTEMA